MKKLLRRLFGFILYFFESGDESYRYKPLNRKILIVVGVLFSGLAAGSAYVAGQLADVQFFIPVGIFGLAGLVCLVVGLLGNDRAVAKIWGGR